MIEQSKYDHIVVDLETLGVKRNSVVVSIGLVRFQPDLGEVQSTDDLRKQSMKIVIDINDSLAEGFKIDGDTLLWWMKQSEEARKATFFEQVPQWSFDALRAVQDFVMAVPGTQVWGNDAKFDIGLLEDYCDVLGLVYPWEFRKVRCYRTIQSMLNYDLALVPKNTLKHDCVADAIFEAQTLQAISICNPGLTWR